MAKIFLTPVGAVVGGPNGLRLIDPPKPCHGFSNGCICPTCLERESEPHTALEQPRQPWIAA
jgi:hypothetical protein